MGSPDSEDRLAEWIEQARHGCPDALGELVEACRPYLLLIANKELGSRLKAKIGASDIVQETLLQARNDIGHFNGQSQREWLAWLRQILLHEVSDTNKYYCTTKKRELGREQPLQTTSGERSAVPITSSQLTPSSEAVAREEAMALRSAMTRMPASLVEVIKLRNWEQLPWGEVGKQMQRSPEAARKLWTRAIHRLKTELQHYDATPSRD